jgi:hypothetical protein
VCITLLTLSCELKYKPIHLKHKPNYSKMITIKELTTLEDFENLKKGEYVACEFKRNVPFKKDCRFMVVPVVENKANTKEIILDRKTNTYFNYEMFLAGESNLESIVVFSI